MFSAVLCVRLLENGQFLQVVSNLEQLFEWNQQARFSGSAKKLNNKGHHKNARLIEKDSFFWHHALHLPLNYRWDFLFTNFFVPLEGLFNLLIGLSKLFIDGLVIDWGIRFLQLLNQSYFISQLTGETLDRQDTVLHNNQNRLNVWCRF